MIETTAVASGVYGVPEDTMFFIVGRGRSGSTLLVRMLDAHPAIAVAEEALFVASLAGRYASGGWSAERIRAFSRDLWREERMRRWGLDRRALEHRLLAVGPSADFARLCAEVYAARAAARGKDGARLLGDKNPHYALFVGELARIFPRARFIHLVRDYRDNILSYREVRFDLSSVGALAYRWRHYNEIVLRAAVEPERFLRVRFEDLVASPTEQLARVCRFLDVEFDAAMLSFHHAAGKELPWHQNVAGPPDVGLMRRWEATMTPRLLALADAVAQPLAETLGYPPSPGVRPAILVPSAAWGWLVTMAERFLFRLPLRARALIIRWYRRSTGNRIE